MYYYSSGNVPAYSEGIALFEPVVDIRYCDERSISEIPAGPLYDLFYDSLLQLTQESFIVNAFIPSDNDRLFDNDFYRLTNLDKDVVLFSTLLPEHIRSNILESGNRYGILIYTDSVIETSKDSFSFRTKKYIVELHYNVFFIVLDALSNTVAYYAQDSNEVAPYSSEQLRKQIRQTVNQMLKIGKFISH